MHRTSIESNTAEKLNGVLSVEFINTVYCSLNFIIPTSNSYRDAVIKWPVRDTYLFSRKFD